MTPVAPDSIRTLFDLVAVHAARTPTNEAMICEGRRWTYMALEQGAKRLGALLGDRGIQQGERVLLMAPTCDSFVAAFFGLLGLGAVPVPVSPLLREVEIIAHARDVGATLLLADSSTSDTLRETFIRAMRGTVIRMDPLRQQVQWQRDGGLEPPVSYFEISAEGTLPPFHPDPDSLATILYTSGSNGRPRGVMLSHRNLLANARAILSLLPDGEPPRTAIALPLHHASALTGQLVTTLLMGGRIQLFRSLAFPFPVLQEIEREGSDMFAASPSAFRILSALPDLGELDLSKVHAVSTVGSPLVREDAVRVRTVFPAARHLHAYGLTEAGPRVTMHEVDPDRVEPGMVGRPLPGVEVRITVEGREAQPLEVGEIGVKSPGVMLGYWQAPADTERALLDGWLHTGDRGAIAPDGTLRILGRQDDMLSCGIEKVSPLEIEHVLERHPQIREAAVTAVEDAIQGERIVAWVVASGELGPADALRHCGLHLARHKVPHEVRLVDRLPRTAQGKVQRARLRADGEQAHASHVTPETPAPPPTR